MNVVLSPMAHSSSLVAGCPLAKSSLVKTGLLRLHHRFVRQAALTPDAVALVHAGRHLTYRALDERSNRIAHVLRGHGVGQGGRVGVCLERCPDLVAALIAILKAGAAYVPLDPAYPRERLDFMLADSRPQVVIVAHDGVTCAGALMTLDEAVLDAAPATPLTDTDTDTENTAALACVFYTSGSTGRPKGVMLGHTATRFIDWAERTFDPQAFARVAATTSICFDPSMFEIFATLSLGGAVVLKRDLLEPFTPDERPTLLNGVPSAFAELVRENRIPDSVRVINVGGERLSASLARAIHQHADNNIRLWNHYGPTEATICASVALVPADVDHDPPIGWPIAGAVFHVLDEFRHPVPTGASGELYIGGPCVALGYLNQPDLTAEQFLPDPFLPGGRMYRTGDMVNATDDGNLVFLGRKGRQIKLRGYRIELDEIEAALTRLTGIDAATALATSGPDGLVDGIGAVVATTGDWTLSRVRRSLRDSLPRHMLPNSLVVLRTLPLTQSGKIDRQALERLEQPEPARLLNADPWLPPLTEAILTVFRDMLSQPAMDAQDDFFDHGGDSLLAFETMLRIEALSGTGAPVCLLSKEASAVGLAGLLSRQQAMLAARSDGGQTIVLQPDGDAPPLFCLAESAARPLQALALAYRLGSGRPVRSLVPYQSGSASNDPNACPEDHLAALGDRSPNEPVLLLAAGMAAPAGMALAGRLTAEKRQVVLVLVAPVFQPEMRSRWRRVRDGLRRIASGWDPDSPATAAPFCGRTILVSAAGTSEAIRRRRRPSSKIERITLPAVGDLMREPAVSLLAEALRARLPSGHEPLISTRKSTACSCSTTSISIGDQT